MRGMRAIILGLTINLQVSITSALKLYFVFTVGASSLAVSFSVSGVTLYFFCTGVSVKNNIEAKKHITDKVTKSGKASVF